MSPVSKEFQIFVKSVGALCSLDCSYCYYLEKQDLYKENIQPIMTDEILEKYITQHLEASNESTILFSWHGGEPTLARIDFYKRVLEFQKQHNVYGKHIINGIQTNGVNLDDEWCQFLAKESFLVGISIDGPEEFHNKFRLSKSGKGTFQSVINGYNLLKKHGITTEILCVVNSSNMNFPIEVYNFFKSIDAKYISFLPLVEKDPISKTHATQKSVLSMAFGDFLIKVYDEWLENDIGKIKIQIFEEALRTAFNQDHTLCVFKKTCGGVPVLEKNGELYSCDHYVTRDYLLGNINNSSLEDLLEGPKQIAFGNQKFNSLPNYCLNCDVLSMCNGECPKNRFIRSPQGEEGLNYLCEGYKKFFNHCIPFINAIRTII
jgi:uncharacterized protein